MNLKNTYNCIIIDDDDLDRLVIQSYVRKYSLFNIIGVYSTASEALPVIEKNKIDVLFSDIDMPEITGIEFRKQWMQIPVCIFITSYPDYAAESFEVAALDFMVKPLSAERFDIAVRRCEEYFSIRQKAELLDYNLGADVIFIKDGQQQIKILLYQIIYLEALKDYTLIVTSIKKYSVLSTIGNLLKENSFRSFVRIHRSYAVQKNYVDTITAQQVIANGVKLPIGRNYKDNLNVIKQ